MSFDHSWNEASPNGAFWSKKLPLLPERAIGPRLHLPLIMTDLEKYEILDWIRSEHAAGRALNLHAVKRRRPELLRRVYEARPFWGWWQAIADAGLDYADLKVELEETVTCRICGYVGFQLNAHLSRRHGTTSAEYRKTYPGAEIASEMRRARMKKEGGNHLLPHWEPLYSDEYMMDRAYRYYTMGHRLRTTWICEHDHNLWQHIHRQGITWESFITALGIPYPDAKTERAPGITREQTLEGLRELVKQEGETPKVTRLTRLNHLLYTGVRRYFDSYDDALVAAGVPLPDRPFPPPRKLSEEEVISEVRELSASGVRITAVEIYKRLRKADLHHAIEKMGGYPEVRSRLGIGKPAPVRMEMPHTRGQVIEAMQRRAAAGKPYTVPSLREGDDADPDLLRSARYHYPKWLDLLADAGLEPIHHAKPRALQRREKMLEALRRRHEAGDPLDRHAMLAADDTRSLYRKASLLFKGWDKALEAAGLPVPAETLRGSRLRSELLEAIRTRHREGMPLDRTRVNNDPGGADLYRQAKRTFLSWKKALLAAGLEWPPPGPAKPEKPAREKVVKEKKARAGRPKKEKPDKIRASKPTRGPKAKRALTEEERAARGADLEQRRQAVIEAIRERHRNQRPLYLRGIRREPEAIELYDEARRCFHTWKAALAAAGCKPEPLPPLPKSKIVEELEAAYPIDPEWLAKVEEMTAPLMLRQEEIETKWSRKEEEARKELDEDINIDFDAETPLHMPPLSAGMPKGWRIPKKGEKQRTTPSKAERRKKRKKGRR